MPWYEVTISFEASSESEATDVLDEMISTYCGCTNDMLPYDENNPATFCKRPSWAASGPVLIPDEEEGDTDDTVA